MLRLALIVLALGPGAPPQRPAQATPPARRTWPSAADTAPTGHVFERQVRERWLNGRQRPAFQRLARGSTISGFSG